MKYKKTVQNFIILLLAALLFSGCAGSHPEPEKPQPSQDVEELQPGLPVGYLAMNELPDSLSLIPPPPEEGSLEYERDLKISEGAMENTDPERLKQAKADCEIYFPGALQAVNIIPGIMITEKSTPYLYMLLRRSLTDAVLSVYAAKDKYRRPRPFMINGGLFCLPEQEESLRADGSYPSAHAAIGRTWALILIRLYPQKENLILQRGDDFGQSRVICNLHWQSDVDQGRIMGEAAAERLFLDPVFMADLEIAKSETVLPENDEN